MNSSPPKVRLPGPSGRVPVFLGCWALFSVIGVLPGLLGLNVDTVRTTALGQTSPTTHATNPVTTDPAQQSTVPSGTPTAGSVAATPTGSGWGDTGSSGQAGQASGQATSTARSSSSQSSRTSSYSSGDATGPVTVTSEASGDDAEAVVEVLTDHGNAINDGRYSDAYNLFSSAMSSRHSFGEWRSGVDTSHWVALTVLSVQVDGSRASVPARLQTTQDPSDGDGHGCLVWNLTYQMVYEGGWRIDKASGDSSSC